MRAIVTALFRLSLVWVLAGFASSVALADAGGQVSEFYGWYLKRIAADDPPALSGGTDLNRYVSAALLRKLNRKFNSPDGMESDYFIQAQDYLDSWTKYIVVVPVSESATRAQFRVQLGEGGELYKLKVVAIREGGLWKIDMVSVLRSP